VPSASLVPENDPSVLFNTAGMQPLVPYLLGQKHPMGTRIADVQKCVRTGDLDDIGDNRHFSFFEMLENWRKEIGWVVSKVKDGVSLSGIEPRIITSVALLSEKEKISFLKFVNR
jgi:hypothetical protein